MKLINVEYTNYELIFFNILKEINVRFFSQEYINIFKNDKTILYKIDFIIPKSFYPEMKPESGIIFEIQGEFHLKKGIRRKDEKKKEDLEKAGYKVYEIWFFEFKNKEELKERIIKILKNEGIL